MMKKRVFSLLLALAMLVSLLPTAIAADAITLPDVSKFTNTYANILDAGFPAQEILEAFPESITTSYDAETEIFTMEDIGAGSASAYYGSYEMTLEDGVWSVPLSQEEYEDSVHIFQDKFGAWEAYYESDGRFRYVNGTAGSTYYYIDGYEVWIQYPHGELVVMDYYNLTDGAFYLQSVWRQIEEDDYCEVYYSADGALPSAYVSRGENLYFYENGEWTLDGEPCDPPEGFETEAEIKAACPFVAPGEESDAPTVTEVVFGEATQDGLFVPLSPSYKYGISQYVIPAEVLQSGVDRNIEALQYRVLHNDDYGTARSVEIRLMEIPNDTVDSFVDVSDAVTVYSGEVYLPGEREDRTVQIDFDTPFTYNGGNLLVSFCDTTGNYVTFTWFDAFSRAGGSVYYYTDQEELAFENLATYKATQTSETPLTTVIFKGDVIPSGKHEVTLEQSGQGEATVFPMRASAGETVSVNAVADVRHKVGSVYVEDENGEEIEVTDGTFVMPDGNVTVYVDFVPMELPVTYTVKMFDLAGNGWGGNALRIFKVDGETETELGVATLESGSEGSYEFIVESGEELRFYWVKGSNARHCTFSISSGESEVHASGALTNDIEDGVLIHSMTAGYVFDINTVNGAQMRVAVGRPQGLRFVSRMGKTEGFHAAVSEYGTVLIPTESLDDGDINNLVIGKTMANGHEVCKVQAKTLYGEDENEVVFTAVITNIAEKNYTRAYTARAYAILEDGSVVYGDSYTSRSIYQIAKLILEDAEASAAEITAAQAIVDVVEKYGDNDASDPWN